MILTPTQQEIIDTNGNLIVRASAGTGKTHTLVHKLTKELEENKSHKVIAAITFTIKAANEIKDRLGADVSQQFIGTNNSFVIDEIIKPFMRDVYGSEFDIDMNTDYSLKVESYSDGIDKLKNIGVLCTYEESEKNFIFELAYNILISSFACQHYLKSKYFKIYIDEYQDCDRDMHKLFMYISDKLKIDTFIVGDEKQSIYMWRGAYPEAFKSIWDKENFKGIFMGDNFRSCQEIQNYTNLLTEETRRLYNPTSEVNDILWIDYNTHNEEWSKKVLNLLDINKEFAILRYSRNNAEKAADMMAKQGIDCKYIPTLPLAEITTETAWLYMAIAQYCIFEPYSVYDLVAEIPVESDETRKNINKIKECLDNIECAITLKNHQSFKVGVIELAEYLNYSTENSHIAKVYKTINEDKYHSAFHPEEFEQVAITFHSSKGLEFEQVVIFAEDYPLNDDASIYNHYVAASRAKNKLVIVNSNNWKAAKFKNNLQDIFAKSGVDINAVISF